MNRVTQNIISAFCILILGSTQLWSQNSYSSPHKVALKRERKDIYTLLNNLSNQTGLNFIYDSNLIKNEQKVRTTKGIFTLEQAVKIITNNSHIAIQLDGNHALLYIPKILQTPEKPITPKRENIPSLIEHRYTIQGKVYDKITKKPLAYASIEIAEKSIGTIANSDGEFRLILHDSLIQTHIKISHLGYQSKVVPTKLLISNNTHFMMEPKIIPLQEVVVRAVDPVIIIEQMLSNRLKNYNITSVNLTTFYREGVEYKKSITMAEAVLEFFKTGIFSNATTDQVRVLKMRKIEDPNQKDTLVAKLKSSINSALLLDIVRHEPNFLSLETINLYNYQLIDITTLDQRRVYVLSFSQKEKMEQPLYRGTLYIDALNFALVEANFQITPKYIKAAKYNFIVKESRRLNIMPESAKYLVSYKLYNGKYYINHVKSQLLFNVKIKKRLMSSPLYVWFEMATCIIDQQAAYPFQRNQRLNLNKIFSETTYNYDPLFWDNFNIILPEEKIVEIIEKYNFNL